MKLSTAERKSQASPQSWNKHIDAFHQRLANKRLRSKLKKSLQSIIGVD
jgi:hypothetical protein